jgi:hypothetical protein
MIFSSSYFKSAIDGCPKCSAGYLANSSSELRFCLIVFDYQFWKIPMLTVDFTKNFNKRKLFTWLDKGPMEFFSGNFNIKNSVFRRSAKV